MANIILGQSETEQTDEVSASTPQSDTPRTSAVPYLVIEPASGWRLINLQELWRHRELLFFFTWRDVKVRYKQTLLGAAWAIIQPFMMMIVFSIFLGRMAGIESGNYPYPVFVYAGLLPWTFFATAISNAGNSVVGSQHIITKVYFPRLIIPFASVGAAVVDFLIAFSMLAALMVYYGIRPGWSMLLLPVLLLLATLAALGVGTLLAALNVAYRDFKYTIPFLVQLWMFATPAVYMHIDYETTPNKKTVSAASSKTSATQTSKKSHKKISPEEKVREAVPESIKALLKLNPMTGLIAFFRAATLGSPLPWTQLGYSTVVIVVTFIGSLFYFRRVESSFADVI